MVFCKADTGNRAAKIAREDQTQHQTYQLDPERAASGDVCGLQRIKSHAGSWINYVSDFTSEN